MHKVDSAGATPQNEFTNGDAQNQIARTRLEAKWCNAVQREVIAPIQQVGLALSDAEDHQLMSSVTMHVATIPALRALAVPVVAAGRPVVIMTRGGAAEGDGGGAFFRWDATAAGADDGATIIVPASNPANGRWLRTSLSSSGISVAWSQLTGVPATFPPSAHGHAVGDVTGAAPLASPAFTGSPTAPTASNGTNSTQLATTQFVQAAIALLINSAPGALDTLNELAAALGNDPNFATTITNALAGKSNVGHGHAAGDITSGQFVDARVALSNVSQHAGSIKTRNFPGRVGTNVTLLAGSGPPNLAGSQDGDAWEYY